MTLYLKYRPQKISELDLDSVRQSLGNIAKSKNIPHAFLFSGPKGTGKTSAARILAKIVNCESASKRLRGKDGIEPCNKCTQCLSIINQENMDVIEMDAASHRGIDDVRALKDAVKLSPASAKKKIYIIDEAHMLTTEASNALLKTLEEPPEHVMFILATTNPEKLITTIRSRTVNVVFKKASDGEILRSLKKKAKGEKLKVDDEVLLEIARMSDNSFRDADKTLEQLITEKIPLKLKNIQNYLQGHGAFNVDNFISMLAEKEGHDALKMVEKAVENGAQIENITNSVLEKLRTALLAKVGVSSPVDINLTKTEIVKLIALLTDSLRDSVYSPIEQLPLEIAIISWCFQENSENNSQAKTDSQSNSKNESAADPVTEKSKKKAKKPKLNGGPNGSSDKSATMQASFTSDGITDDIWVEVLSSVRPVNASTEALLRASKPIKLEGQRLILGVFYKFHKEKLESNPHRGILEDAIGKILGMKVRLVCELSDPPKKEHPKEDVILVETDNGRDDKVIEVTIDNENQDDSIVKIAEEIFRGN